MDEKYVRTLVQTNENDEFASVVRDYTNDVVLNLAREIERLRAEIVEWDRVCKQHVKQCQKLSKKLRNARQQERERCVEIISTEFNINPKLLSIALKEE